jgi:general secretion pathway protein D
MVEDGGIIVLGGLISDQVLESKRTCRSSLDPAARRALQDAQRRQDKTNLMVFIRPRILRDGVDAAIETNAKYNYIRTSRRSQNKGRCR